MLKRHIQVLLVFGGVTIGGAAGLLAPIKTASACVLPGRCSKGCAGVCGFNYVTGFPACLGCDVGGIFPFGAGGSPPLGGRGGFAPIGGGIGGGTCNIIPGPCLIE